MRRPGRSNHMVRNPPTNRKPKPMCRLCFDTGLVVGENDNVRILLNVSDVLDFLESQGILAEPEAPIVPAVPQRPTVRRIVSMPPAMPVHNASPSPPKKKQKFPVVSIHIEICCFIVWPLMYVFRYDLSNRVSPRPTHGGQ